MEILHPHKVFLDAPRANEPIKDADTSSLVVRPASTGTTERLLTHDGASAFFVVVDITSGITEFIGCGEEGFTVRGKAVRSAVLLVRHWGRREVEDLHGTGQCVIGARIDKSKSLLKLSVFEYEDLSQFVRI